MPETQATQFQSLGREDALEKEMATHANILAWRSPTEEPGRLSSTESDMTEVTEQQQQIGHSFSSKEQASFDFMAAVTICSDLAWHFAGCTLHIS